MPPIPLLPLPAALPFSLALLRGAATAVEVTLAVSEPRVPPPPPAAPSPPLGATAAVAVQMSEVSSAAAARIPPCPRAVPPFAPPPPVPTPDPPVSRVHWLTAVAIASALTIPRIPRSTQTRTRKPS